MGDGDGPIDDPSKTAANVRKKGTTHPGTNGTKWTWRRKKAEMKCLRCSRTITWKMTTRCSGSRTRRVCLVGVAAARCEKLARRYSDFVHENVGGVDYGHSGGSEREREAVESRGD